MMSRARLASPLLAALLCAIAAAACNATTADDGPRGPGTPDAVDSGPGDGGGPEGDSAIATPDAPGGDGALPKSKPGTFDVSFGIGGVFSFSTFGEGEIAHVVEGASGYVFAGTTSDKTGDSLQLGAVTKAGALDTAFGAGGRTIVKLSGDLHFDRAHQLVAVPGAGWLVAGKVADQPSLVRFAASGALLTTFGAGGVAAPPTQGGGESFGAIRLADGSFVAFIKRDITLGTFEYNLRAFSTTGVPQETRAKISASSFAETFEAKNGGVWVLAGVPAAKTNGTRHFVTRYSPPGQFSTFSASPNPDQPSVTPTDGIFADGFKSIGGVVDNGKTLTLQINDPGGSDRLVRVDATTGALDPTFGTAGTVNLVFPTTTSRTLLAVDASGGAIVALRDSATSNDTLVRLDASGKRDVSFGSTGQLVIPFSVYSARIDSTGHLILAGAKFTSTSGGNDAAMRIGRVNL